MTTNTHQPLLGPPATCRRTCRRTRRGLSMVEAMVSLAICSALLVAAGTAFTASASAVQNNTDFTKASQTARVTMKQMLVEVRRSDSVQCPSTPAASTYFDVIRPNETITPNEVFRRYAYDATARQLTLQIFYSGNAAGPRYVLANNISAASFGPP